MTSGGAWGSNADIASGGRLLARVRRTIMKQFSLLLLSCLFAWTPSAPAAAVSSVAAKPLNVVLVLVDDVGYSDFGCFGGEISTPNIDRLAREGMRFTSFYVNPTCNPTRYSIHTGRYPVSGRSLRKVVNIAEAFRAAGYHTSLSGKWDLGRHAPERAIDCGYMEFFGLIEGCSNYFDPAIRDPEFEGGRMRYWGRNAEIVKDFPDGFYATDAITDHAVEMIRRSVDAGKPFFANVCYTAAHSPLQAKPEDVKKYRGRYDRGWDEVRQARLERQKQVGILDPRWMVGPREPEVKAWDDEPLKEWNARLMEVYAAMVDCVDQNVGRLLNVLEETGTAENTLVVVLSDNGGNAEQAGGDDPTNVPGSKDGHASCGAGWAYVQNTPFRRYKHWAHEGGIASPLIIRAPGIARPGSVSTQVAHAMDLMPTLLQLTAVEVPARRDDQPAAALEGISLASAVRGKESAVPRTLYWGWKDNRALRDGPWKLVWDQNVRKWELYRLPEDRTESNDLAAVHPERVRAMAARWDEWASSTGAVRNLGTRMILKPGD